MICLHALAFSLMAFVSLQENWSQWRGPEGTGASATARPPVEWSETKNLLWKTPIEGTGHGSPVISGDMIFLTVASPIGEAMEPRFSGALGAHDNVAVSHRHEFSVIGVSRQSGKIRWIRSVHETLPHEGGHVSGTLASASPVADEDRVYAYFGSHGLYCLDREGEVVWTRDFGDMSTKHGHGEGSSPALFEDALVINWDHEGQSFLTVLDKRNGEEKWKIDRDEVTSWSTPIVARVDGKPQVIVSGTKRVRGYDLETGKMVWECGGLSRNVVASPIYSDGVVYAGSSYQKQAMLAVRVEGAEGDLTAEEEVLWYRNRRTPYVPSPLLYRGNLYMLRHYQGMLVTVDAQTGRDTIRRLEGIVDVYSSPVAAAGRVYVTGREGTTVVIDAESGETVARNVLDDGFSASAALQGEVLYLRGHKNLYALGEK